MYLTHRFSRGISKPKPAAAMPAGSHSPPYVSPPPCASQRWRWTRPRRRAGHSRASASLYTRFRRLRRRALMGPQKWCGQGVTSATTSPGACAAVGPRPATEAALIAAASAAATGLQPTARADPASSQAMRQHRLAIRALPLPAAAPLLGPPGWPPPGIGLTACALLPSPPSRAPARRRRRGGR